MQNLTKLKIPEGWALERADHFGDQAYLSTPGPTRYVATIDFALRGFRSGMVVTGRLYGDDLVKKTKRKKFEGRGWAQALVNHAADHLRGLL